MLPFFLKAILVFVTVKKAARYPVASTRFNCACEVGGGEGFALVRNSYANVGIENFSIGGKSKTSFTILGFSLGTQFGKILVAADM